MNPAKGLFFLSALALSVAIALPAQAQTKSSGPKMSAKREAAVKKCFEEASAARPAGTSSGFIGADVYRSCMAKLGHRP
jgi:hypothetical protein